MHGTAGIGWGYSAEVGEERRGREVMREDVPHFRLFRSVLSFYGGVLVSPSVLGTVVQLPLFFCDYESKTAVWSAPLLLFPLRNNYSRSVLRLPTLPVQIVKLIRFIVTVIKTSLPESVVCVLLLKMF